MTPIDERPPRGLPLHFEKYVPNSDGGSPTIPILQIVFIPAGAERELARLHQELTVRCPKAQIRLP
jgi:hypothetical protein